MIASMGWRACFNFMGTIGLVFGALGMLLVREPERGGIRKYENQVNGVQEVKVETDLKSVEKEKKSLF